MAHWTEQFAPDLWLQPDDTGGNEAAFIAAALHLRRGDGVLDVPCGAGRIAVNISRLGCHVTGVDLQPSFIARARRRFRHDGLPGVFRAGDIRKIRFAPQFHGAYCWQGSFGYFSDIENADVLGRMAASLRKGGRLLIDQPNREYLLRHFSPVHTNNKATVHARWIPQTQRVESDWSRPSNKKTEHNRLSIRLYTPAQMRRLFVTAHLAVEAVYGTKLGGLFSRSSKRMVMVGIRQ